MVKAVLMQGWDTQRALSGISEPDITYGHVTLSVVVVPGQINSVYLIVDVME